MRPRQVPRIPTEDEIKGIFKAICDVIDDFDVYELEHIAIFDDYEPNGHDNSGKVAVILWGMTSWVSSIWHNPKTGTWELQQPLEFK